MKQSAQVDFYSFSLERQASRFAASLPLPEPNTNSWLFRLVRLPAKGRETMVDVEKRGGRFFVTVSRFLIPLRRLWESHGRPHILPKGIVPVEISISTLPVDDPFNREIMGYTPLDCLDAPSNDPAADHYFCFFTDTRECNIAAISNPYENRKAESWHRLINRSYAAELVAPRRQFATDVIIA